MTSLFALQLFITHHARVCTHGNWPRAMGDNTQDASLTVACLLFGCPCVAQTRGPSECPDHRGSCMHGEEQARSALMVGTLKRHMKGRLKRP